MIRRFHVHQLRTGYIDLDTAEAHHVRDVLRLTVGTSIQLFDDAGRSASGPLVMVNPSVVRVEITAIEIPTSDLFQLTVASAVPKGERADWMIEKLSELGVNYFIPLATERSVVLPTGRNKIERWERIALEAAKQSRRAGVMKIAELTPLTTAIENTRLGWFLSTAPNSIAIQRGLHAIQPSGSLSLLIGPEGGWTEGEIGQFRSVNFASIALTNTILRVETAAITAAAIVLCAMKLAPVELDSL